MIHEIKLLDISKKRAEHLRNQKVRFGLHCPPYIKSELDDVLEEIEGYEETLKRRRQGLLEKAALYGANTDPAISIEIEDINEYFGDK
jgi:hypothetical protein